jgi:SNF2 family DNA or RNA helicase
VDANGADVPLTADDIYRALIEQKAIEGTSGLQPPDGLKLSRYPLIPSLTLSLDQRRSPFLALTGRSRGTVEDLSMADLERGHVTVGGNWFPIDEALAAEITTLLADTGATPGPCPLQAFLRLRRAAAKGSPVEDLIGSSPLSPLAFTPISEDVPQVNATLYSYQLAGWRWLRFIRSEGLGGVLADEMGLGKSLQVIAAIQDPYASCPSPCLIVAPGSLLENWCREIARFAPDLRTLKHHGPNRTGRPADLQGYDVVITSYDTVVRDNSLLNMIEWDMVVLDEAQFIRNPDAQRAKAAKRLRRRVGLAVTGTPIENRLLDLWSIVDFALPGQLGDRRSFDASYPDDLEGARSLELDVSPFLLRRRVSEVAQDLPSRIDIPQIVELSQVEAAAYEATRQRIDEEYGAAATLVALTELRRFCAHPQLLMGGTDGDYMEFSKFERLDEILREIFIKGEKVLIFTSFTTKADIIAQHVQSMLHAFAGVIDGRLPIDDRQPLIDVFTVEQ